MLHVDTNWKFKEMIQFRTNRQNSGCDLLVHKNPDGLAMDINPFVHGSSKHTDIMKTEGLKQALNEYGFDAAFGGARRDERNPAPRSVSTPSATSPTAGIRRTSAELWRVYNSQVNKGESIRVFPLSNWTELDIWQYIYLENIDIVPLYFAAMRPWWIAAASRSWWMTIASPRPEDEVKNSRSWCASVPSAATADRGHRTQSRHPAGDHRRDADPPPVSGKGGSSTTIRPAPWSRRRRQGYF
ncbi:phosphoadenosine phosphosulfate reductase family protein [Escherichia coli]